jgi:anaerobic carbon-monoxide dehydrogenase iron sulfur subunit
VAIRLLINTTPCTGCLSCVSACSQRRAGCSDPHASAIHVQDQPFTGVNEITTCRQCRPAAPCAVKCPAGAICWDDAVGAWWINPDVCFRCGACAEACPYGAMSWQGEPRVPIKCDLCRGKPVCLEACHFGALRAGDAGGDEQPASGIPAEDLDPMLGRGP